MLLIITSIIISINLFLFLSLFNMSLKGDGIFDLGDCIIILLEKPRLDRSAVLIDNPSYVFTAIFPE